MQQIESVACDTLVEGMSSVEIGLWEAAAHSVSVDDDVLVVDFADGRTVTVPLA